MMKIIDKSIIAPAPVLREAERIADHSTDAETVATELRKLFPRLFIYRGGHHVAVHSASHTEAYFRVVERP